MSSYINIIQQLLTYLHLVTPVKRMYRYLGPNLQKILGKT